MKVIYVTVRFPVPTETFAGLDVLTLVRAGVEVRVLALRAPHRHHAQMIRERGLSGIAIEVSTPRTWFAGVAYMLERPTKTLQLFGFIVRNSWRRPAHLAWSLLLLPSVMRCFQRIEQDRPDVVHLFWGHFPSMVGYLVARYLPGTVLSHFLGAYDLEYHYGPTVPVIRDADLVWTHANINIPRLEALGVARRRIHVAYRGIDTGDVAADNTRVARRVVSAGRMIPVKAFDKLLHTFKLVHDRFADATLVIAGDGPERASLEQLSARLGIRDVVQFVGQIPQSDLFARYQQAQVFLFMPECPTDRLPNVAKEAALRGCAVVITNSTGMDELFTHGEDAFVVDYGDTASAAAHVNRLLEEDDVRARMSTAARQRIIDAFDVKNSMARYIESWTVAIATKSRSSGVPPRAED